MSIDYALEPAKWGSNPSLGTAGGQVTWNLSGSFAPAYQAEIAAAFTRWSQVANISFVHVQDNGPADITLSWSAIDGPGKVLGQSTYRYGGGLLQHADITLDSTESWTSSANGLVDPGNDYFRVVAMHEIGHAIGLDHYNASTAVMNSYVTPNLRDLTQSDIDGAAALYGPADGLTLRVSEDAWQGDAQFVVLVDGHQVGDVQTAHASHASGQWDTVTLPGSFGPGPHSVAVDFLNDAWGGSASTDRNLYVESASLNGVDLPGSAQTLLGTHNMALFGSPDILSLRVSEDAWLGDAQFIVSVDGHQVGGTQTAHASHASGQWDTVTLGGSFGAGPHSVAVDFLNDAWGGTANTDRNLYVQSATLNGTLMPGVPQTLVGPHDIAHFGSA